MVLCNYSSFFDRLCDGGFREATANEVGLIEDSPGLVARLVLALYTGKYDGSDGIHDILASSADAEASAEDTIQQEAPSTLHAHMYALGDRLLVPALKSSAAGLLTSSLKKPNRRLSEHTAAFRTVYNLTADGGNALRKVVVYEAQNSGSEYRQDPRFKAVIRTCPGFAADMLLTMPKKGYGLMSSLRAACDFKSLQVWMIRAVQGLY